MLKVLAGRIAPCLCMALYYICERAIPMPLSEMHKKV